MTRDKAQSAFDDWQRAEERFAEVLATFTKSGFPAKVKKESALELAKLRGKANMQMDRFFKRAL